MIEATRLQGRLLEEYQSQLVILEWKIYGILGTRELKGLV